MPTTKTVSARIRPSEGRGLWLFIDQIGMNKVSAEDLNMLDFARIENEAGQVAYAILPEEVEAIKQACEEWLAAQEAEVDRLVDSLVG